MKTIFATIALALSVLTASAQYQGSFVTDILAGGTNKVTALTTNEFLFIDVPRTEYVNIFVDFKFLNAPGSGDATSIKLDLYRGIDSSRRESNVWQTVTVPGNSTTAISTNFSVTVAGVPALWARLANLSTNSHATNITLSYSFKR